MRLGFLRIAVYDVDKARVCVGCILQFSKVTSVRSILNTAIFQKTVFSNHDHYDIIVFEDVIKSNQSVQTKISFKKVPRVYALTSSACDTTL